MKKMKKPDVHELLRRMKTGMSEKMLTGLVETALLRSVDAERRKNGKYSDEKDIYRKAVRSHREERESGCFVLNEIDARYMESRIDGHSLYVIGEAHGSINPVEMAHKKIVPMMLPNPATWLMLVEDAELYATENALHENLPSQFYFMELALCLKVPCEDALADLDAEDTRKYIQMVSGIGDRDIDRALLTMLLMTSMHEEIVKSILTAGKTEDWEQVDLEKIFQHLSTCMGKPVKEIAELYDSGPLGGFDRLVGKPWNEFSRMRLHKLLEKYPDRTNVLVNVGWNHFPVFE